MTTVRRLLVVLALVLAGLAAPAGAQDAPSPTQGGAVESWTLVPGGPDEIGQAGNRPNLTYTTAAGSTIQDEVTLLNYSTVPMTFRVYAADAFNTDDGGFDVLKADETSTGVGAWVTLPLEELTLQPNEQVTLPVTIDVPADASPGDHVGALVASSYAEGTSSDGKAVGLDRRTGTRVYLRVDGPIEQRLTVEDVSSSYDPSLNPLSGTATVTYTIANRGNVRLGGTSYVTASGPLGVLEKASPEQELAELLPGETVTYTTTLDGVAATGLATAEVHVDPIAAEGDEDSLGETTKGSLTLAVPFTLLALALIGGLAWFAIRRYRRHRGEPTRPSSGPPAPGTGGPGRGTGPASAGPRPLERQHA